MRQVDGTGVGQRDLGVTRPTHGLPYSVPQRRQHGQGTHIGPVAALDTARAPFIEQGQVRDRVGTIPRLELRRACHRGMGRSPRGGRARWTYARMAPRAVFRHEEHLKDSGGGVAV